MIKFEKIRWKNFLAAGNSFIEISLDTSSTTLIIGSNGSGKSTVLDALCFSLFNKSFRKINKNQLVNTTNEKDCCVEVEFSIGSNQYKIVRGIKPAIFEIWKNNKIQNQSASSSEQQKHLEQNILRLNYKSFTQIVILGSSNFVPFMQLTPSSRREVIEDLLDIRIFSSMNSITKDRLKESKDIVSKLTLEKNNCEDKIQMQKDFIETIKNQNNDNIKNSKEKISKLYDEIDLYVKENSSLEESISKYTKDQEKLIGSVDKLVKLNNLKGKISQRASSIAKEHKFFTENSVCPTCTQTIEEDFRVNRIEDTQKKATEIKKGYQDLEEAIKTEHERECQFNILSKEIVNLTHDVSQNTTRISFNQRQIRDLESEIQRVTNNLKNRNIEQQKLDDLEEKYKSIDDQLNSKKEYQHNLEKIHYLLKDDGVKTKIVKKYLPIINQQINRYLQLMDFYINFKLDQEFNETVESPIHEDFSYSSFSEGEKMRIDLALLFTWREVAKLKNSSSTNLLIMDEVFDSSLDGYGTDEFTKIIMFVVKNSNIFVISHKNELYDKFDSVLKFDKVKGFSSMVKTV